MNSISQFNITDVGTTIKCGPHIPKQKKTQEMHLKLKGELLDRKRGSLDDFITTKIAPEQAYKPNHCVLLTNNIFYTIYGHLIVVRLGMAHRTK